MPTKRKEYQRFAVLTKDSGEVLKIKNMRYGYEPTLDPERYIAVKVGDDVEPGMVLTLTEIEMRVNATVGVTQKEAA